MSAWLQLHHRHAARDARRLLLSANEAWTNRYFVNNILKTIFPRVRDPAPPNVEPLIVCQGTLRHYPNGLPRGLLPKHKQLNTLLLWSCQPPKKAEGTFPALSVKSTESKGWGGGGAEFMQRISDCFPHRCCRNAGKA